MNNSTSDYELPYSRKWVTDLQKLEIIKDGAVRKRELKDVATKMAKSTYTVQKIVNYHRKYPEWQSVLNERV